MKTRRILQYIAIEIVAIGSVLLAYFYSMATRDWIPYADRSTAHPLPAGYSNIMRTVYSYDSEQRAIFFLLLVMGISFVGVSILLLYTDRQIATSTSTEERG